MGDRKKREIVATDSMEILANVENTSYNDLDKERLKIQAFRLNDEMVNQQIGIPELVKKTGISQGAIGQYKTGKVLIKEDLLQPLCDAFGVSRNYLRGIANSKRYEYEELNEMFGLNDNAINNIIHLKNKELLNLIFDNDEIELQFLLDQTKEYVIAKNKLKKFEEEYVDDDRIEYNEKYIKLYGDVRLASFNMSEEYIRLIENNLK